MMTKLIFFDTFENSKKGIIRGLIAFISLIIFDIIWFSLSSKYTAVYNSVKDNNILSKRNIIPIFLIYLIMCSAIAVQLPGSFKEALVYGLLVGFVIYSVFNLTSYVLFPEWNIKTGIIDTIAGTINCGIASSMIYLFCHNNK